MVASAMLTDISLKLVLFSLPTLLLVHLPGAESLPWELYIQIEIGHTDWIHIYIRHSKQIEQNKP